MPKRFNQIAEAIVSGEEGAILLNLDEFEALYKTVERIARDSEYSLEKTQILLLTENSIVRFSTAPRFIIQLRTKRALQEEDFKFVISPEFEGNIRPIPLRAFIWTETRQNGLLLLVAFVLLVFLLSFDTEHSALQSINQMLVEANALFIGIFILFTISQNRELLTRTELVRKGHTHRMMQTDRWITWLAITSLILAFLSTAISGVIIGNAQLPKSIVNLKGKALSLSRGITALSFILLVDGLLAVTRYYLRLMRTAIEGEMYRRLMTQDKKTQSGEKSN